MLHSVEIYELWVQWVQDTSSGPSSHYAKLHNCGHSVWLAVDTTKLSVKCRESLKIFPDKNYFNPLDENWLICWKLASCSNYIFFTRATVDVLITQIKCHLFFKGS